MRNPAPGFDQPLEMLQACHGRIEERLQTLERLAEHAATRGPDANAQSAAKDVLRYFDTSGAQHHQDEDEDLFPLLRKRAAASGRNEVAAAVDELEREHAMERESLLVLPFAKEALTPDERAQLGKRMAARRARPQ